MEWIGSDTTGGLKCWKRSNLMMEEPEQKVAIWKGLRMLPPWKWTMRNEEQFWKYAKKYDNAPKIHVNCWNKRIPKGRSSYGNKSIVSSSHFHYFITLNSNIKATFSFEANTQIHNCNRTIFGVHVLGLEWAPTGSFRPPVALPSLCRHPRRGWSQDACDWRGAGGLCTLRLPNGAGPCCRTTHLKVIVQKVTGMAASRIMNPPKKQKKDRFWSKSI